MSKPKMCAVVLGRGRVDLPELPDAYAVAAVFPNGQRIEMRWDEANEAVQIRGAIDGRLAVLPQLSNAVLVKIEKP